MNVWEGVKSSGKVVRTGNGAINTNFAPIDLKPRIWTFQSGSVDAYEAGAAIRCNDGKWGSRTQFCSDRPKTSDLDVSDGLLSIPAVV